MIDPRTIAVCIPILALLIPIIAILTHHQRKMAELIHENLVADPRLNGNQLPHSPMNSDSALILAELQQMRQQLNTQTLEIDTLKSRLSESSAMVERLNQK